MSRRRLLSISHSYCVALNRRLPDEIARAGDWDVTAVAPSRFHGDFGWHTLEARPGEVCRVEGVPVHWSGRVHVMTYGARLRSLLREPWDVVHCWEEPYVAAAAQVAAWTPARVPLVFATFQNISKAYPPPFAWFERYALRRASGVIAFGATALEVLRERQRGALATNRRSRNASGAGCGTANAGHDIQLRMIPPGVDVDHFKPADSERLRIRRALAWEGDVPVIGFLGRFVPEKGLATLTTALDRIDMPWRALFVGSGPAERTLRSWAARYGNRVAIETNVGHDDVAAYLNAMDVLCAPSQTTSRWREQFGRMLIEAFACGVPVIASDSGEIPSVVADAGIVVGEADTEGWRREIARVIDDAALRARLSAAGRRRALDVYDWKIVARRHLELFDALSGQAAPAWA
jgi:glycosyltransferase involved in cell wall biosynthesis